MVVQLERVKTGVPGFDEMVEGGLKRGSVVTVSGDCGAGKTTFCLQFLYNGVVKYDEPGMFITYQSEPRGELFENASRFGWKLKEQERAGKLFFAEYPAYAIGQFIKDEKVLYDIIRKKGIKRIAIDSITTVALAFDSEMKRREHVLRLIEQLRDTGCTVLMTSEAEASAITPSIPYTRFGLEILTDGLVYFYNMRRRDVRERAVEVVKLRGTAHSNKICPLKFTDKGLVIYPEEHVFGGVE